MEKTVKDFARLLVAMQEGGRPFWRALATICDDEGIDVLEAIEWLTEIDQSNEI